jgi:hypothetical protein
MKNQDEVDLEKESFLAGMSRGNRSRPDTEVPLTALGGLTTTCNNGCERYLDNHHDPSYIITLHSHSTQSTASQAVLSIL